MVGFRELALALALALPLGGCSWLGFGDDEETVPEAEIERPAVPVVSVSNIEIGRTRRGFAITAYGSASAPGFTRPELRARRDGQPAADGFLDFDFVAVPPLPEARIGAGTEATRAIRADALVPVAAMQGIAGIRVFGATGGMQITF